MSLCGFYTKQRIFTYLDAWIYVSLQNTVETGCTRKVFQPVSCRVTRLKRWLPPKSFCLTNADKVHPFLESIQALSGLDCILLQLVLSFSRSLAQILARMWTFGLSLQFWLRLQTHWEYLCCCGRKAGGELRCWTLSHFEHSAQLLICSHKREEMAHKPNECEPVHATWLWGMVRLEAPFIYQEQCSCQCSYWLLRLSSSVCIGSNISYSTSSAHSVSDRGHGPLFSELFWKWCTAKAVVTAESWCFNCERISGFLFTFIVKGKVRQKNNPERLPRLLCSI